jgi:hypothetical protein
MTTSSTRNVIHTTQASQSTFQITTGIEASAARTDGMMKTRCQRHSRGVSRYSAIGRDRP